MRILLLSGLGPTIKNSELLSGTFFDDDTTVNGPPQHHVGLGRSVGRQHIHYRGATAYPVLRPRRGAMPHLSSSTLASILDGCGREYELFPLEDVWSGQREPSLLDADVVALSTTFICNRATMHRALAWIRERLPRAALVVGGQYSNLKYIQLMRELSSIDFIVRGDGEIALPMLLDALEGKADIGAVPNLVRRAPGGIGSICNEFTYIDLERHPSPRFRDTQTVVPYESMRGCPFTCKFCSFPFASPQWRYKSSGKICRDWEAYASDNGAKLIKALDSTFTVPPKRLRELLGGLPKVGVDWEAYTRANVIDGLDVVQALEAARCRTLSIGFESMSDASLRRMHKQVSAEQNARANALLARSRIDVRSSFMVGYPGETPEEYEQTHRFLVDAFQGRFMVAVFSLTDETMPVWKEAERYRLEITDPEEPDYAWRHAGMDVETARRLHRRTLREARWQNDLGVLLLWQMKYEMPLVPDRSLEDNYRIEKLLERLAFAPKDFIDAPQRVAALSSSLVIELSALGVHVD
ncbi:B12-binding domain-containing radical SAM protein [Sorangium sp. So ce388]|uniref:B12-binding domain-containing radical SAM protein n=1 Tax=Sorangium sp. So ce388 TaxID=3133309 RepID=UPI003F5C7FCA